MSSQGGFVINKIVAVVREYQSFYKNFVYVFVINCNWKEILIQFIAFITKIEEFFDFQIIVFLRCTQLQILWLFVKIYALKVLCVLENE